MPEKYYGFAKTQGGEGKTIVHVTNLNDSGAGSLREAIEAGGNRHIVFDVGGTITLASELDINFNYVTVDGYSAPSPGITLSSKTLRIGQANSVHDIVVRYIECVDSDFDGIQLFATNGDIERVIIDHCAIFGSADGSIDITATQGNTCQNIDVGWCVLGEVGGTKNAIFGSGGNNHTAYRIAAHHNVWTNTGRNPLIESEVGVAPPDNICDFRNNVVQEWFSFGSSVQEEATANLIRNHYRVGSQGGNADDAIDLDTVTFPNADAFTGGNVSDDGEALNGIGAATTPYTEPDVIIPDVPATVAVQLVKRGAGTRYKSTRQQTVLDLIAWDNSATTLSNAVLDALLPDPPAETIPLTKADRMTFLVNNKVGDATISTNVADAKPVTNMQTRHPRERWRGSATAAEITFRLGSNFRSDTFINAFALAGHNLTWGATLELRHSDDNFATDDVLATRLYVPEPPERSDYQPLLFAFFPRVLKPDWKLVIDDSTNPDGYLEMGVPFLGLATETSEYGASYPWSSTPNDPSSPSFSASGALAGNRTYRQRTLTTQVHTGQSKDIYQRDGFLDMAMQLGTSQPCFLILFPLDTTNKGPRTALYGVFTQVLDIGQEGFGIFNLENIQFSEIL